MLAKAFLSAAAFCGLVVSAQADNLATPSLPVFARDPQIDTPASAPQSSPWSGLTVGSEVFAVAVKGAKGGFGGAGFASYDHEFANNLIVDIEGTAGYSPNLDRYSRIKGYDFASTDITVGYDMGRLVPYFTAGVTLAKATTLDPRGFTTTSDSLNDLFAASNPKAFTRVGAGFDYAINNHLSMGLRVSVSRGEGVWGPDQMFFAY